MKAQKVITIITIILLVVIITLASFLGIYKKEEYRVSNKVPDYILGMEFTNSRIVDFKVSDENSNEVLIPDNYNLSKNILKNRLNALRAEQYNIREDASTGNIQVQMPENDDTQTIISNLAQRGAFELKDNETNEVLLSNNDIDNSKVVYGQTETGNTVYLQIKFNKEGAKKLQEISQKYVATTAQVANENGELEDKEETKEVAIVFDGETYRTTYFGDTITDGTLNVAMGTGSDAATLNQYANTASQMAIVLNSGVLPIIYNTSGYQISSSIEKADFNILMYIAIAILLLMTVYSLVKLKSKGILVAILEVGYISFLLLALRYTNIKITLEGFVGIIASIVLSYMYIYSVFKNSSDNFIKDTTAKFALKLIPIYIIAIVFTFNSIANISSLGMTLVWGIITMYLYNLILTQITVKTIESK